MLLGSALASVVGALYHPTVRAPDPASTLIAMAETAALNSGVHAFILSVIFVQLVGFYGFSARLGIHRPLVAAGLILFGLGTISGIAAAAINGFALPAFASAYGGAPPDQELARVVLRLCWALNQAWSAIGAVTWGAAIILWSVALAQERGTMRMVGVAGLIAGLSIAGGVATGLLELDVHGFLLMVALLALWSGTVGWQMLSGRLGHFERPLHHAAHGPPPPALRGED
jgi:hypothetical protein